MTDELNGTQNDRAEARHGSARQREQQMSILIPRSHPHAAACPVLLETAFVQAPQFHIRASSHPAQFLLPPRLSTDRPERLGYGVYAAESPSGETVFGIVVHPSPRHGGAAGAPRAPARPGAARPKSRGVLRRSLWSLHHYAALSALGRPHRRQLRHQAPQPRAPQVEAQNPTPGARMTAVKGGRRP